MMAILVRYFCLGHKMRTACTLLIERFVGNEGMKKGRRLDATKRALNHKEKQGNRGQGRREGAWAGNDSSA